MTTSLNLSLTETLYITYAIFLTFANAIIGTEENVEVSERGVGACVGMGVIV